jgi:hypothetical protein
MVKAGSLPLLIELLDFPLKESWSDKYRTVETNEIYNVECEILLWCNKVNKETNDRGRRVVPLELCFSFHAKRKLEWEY